MKYPAIESVTQCGPGMPILPQLPGGQARAAAKADGFIGVDLDFLCPADARK